MRGAAVHPAYRRDGRRRERDRKGYPQREIAASAYRFQQQLEAGERVMVGVNKYESDDGGAVPLLRIDEVVQSTQVANLKRVKASRDAARVSATLAAVRAAARSKPGEVNLTANPSDRRTGGPTTAGQAELMSRGELIDNLPHRGDRIDHVVLMGLFELHDDRGRGAGPSVDHRAQE